MTDPGHALRHTRSRISIVAPFLCSLDIQIKERKLAGRAAMIVHKATGKVTPENGPQVVSRDL